MLLQHRFVYESVKGLIPEGFEINHKNEAKTHNRIKKFLLIRRISKKVLIKQSYLSICKQVRKNYL